MDSDRDEDELEGYDPPRDSRDTADSGAYWRRRFLILGGGIVALGLCAWLIPGSHPSLKPTANVRQSTPVATPNTLPPAAYGPAYGSPSPKASSKPSPVASRTPTSAAKSSKASTAYHPSPSASPTAPGGASCAPGDIVLSLFTTSPSYPQQALPTFDVYAVSTAAAPCTMIYGPGAVHVVVTQQGHVVWDSAACKPKPGSLVRLTRGVPQEVAVTWNRHATTPSGCAGVLPAGASGTFDVVAIAAGKSSPVRTFSLAKS